MRRATLIPCSAKISAILLSLNGLAGVSAATSFLISSLIAVEEQSPPFSVLTWLEKKYLSSNIHVVYACIFELLHEIWLTRACLRLQQYHLIP